ncbi:MAG: N-acetylneuraminate synthase family protein [Rhodopseudomonas palustris]|uniref:N-acetylneuraminate synthase family protein n=1 Tax=Rhodopseudomonas palustris TaxID=1076 RepID=A0A933S2K6_RHOPL|nr:N-acetylneuraminate synthase family protein [Rhodopseudomonas palustris]
MDFFSRSFSFAESDPPVVIGEIGVNHNGDPALAKRLVDVAVEAGVDIVKFQAFKTEKAVSRFAAMAPYQEQSGSTATNQLELARPLELSGPQLVELKAYCDQRNMPFLCTAFDFDSLDMLVDTVKITTMKVASSEVTNIPFLQQIGRHGLAAILSTGASTLEEVGTAIEALRASGCPELILLHCVSSYPTPADQLNLRAIQTLKREFGLPVGFSDHSEGTQAAVVSVALGAVAIEKHFTLDRSMEGPDHAASLEPDELKSLVSEVALAHRSLGDGVKRPMPCEIENLPLIRKSLVANFSLTRGTRLSREMIEIKSPANGLHPGELDKVLGRVLACDLEEDRPITWDCLV